MEDLIEFFLNTSSQVFAYETIEITHPSFSQDYFLVRNNSQGITVTLEDLSQQFFEFTPMKVLRSGQSTNIDDSIKIELADLGVVAGEIQNIREADTFDTYPVFTYRAYRSDDLTTILEGPFVLRLVDIPLTKGRSILVAKAPNININRTGELFTIERFPMLRGFVSG
jgi:hypothetical protein